MPRKVRFSVSERGFYFATSHRPRARPQCKTAIVKCRQSQTQPVQANICVLVHGIISIANKTATLYIKAQVTPSLIRITHSSPPSPPSSTIHYPSPLPHQRTLRCTNSRSDTTIPHPTLPTQPPSPLLLPHRGSTSPLIQEHAIPAPQLIRGENGDRGRDDQRGPAPAETAEFRVFLQLVQRHFCWA
jgi:hypothetical protein